MQNNTINNLRVGDFVRYKDFPHHGVSQIVVIKMGPSLNPVALLVDRFGNTGEARLEMLYKTNNEPENFSKVFL